MSDALIATVLLFLIGIATFFGLRDARTRTAPPEHRTFGGVLWWSAKHSIYSGLLVLCFFGAWLFLA